MDPAQYPLQKQQAWFLVFCEHGNGNENEKLAERSERCKHRDGVQVSRRCSCHSAHLLQWLEQGIRARAPKRTPTKFSASVVLARPPAKVREQGRRQQRTQPGGLGSRLRLHRVEHGDEEVLLARRNTRRPSPLPPPTSLGPLPKFASKADVSKEPSRVVSGNAGACIGHLRGGKERENENENETSGEDRYGPSTVPAAKATGLVFGFLRAREWE